jgi:hypothetical protein
MTGAYPFWIDSKSRRLMETSLRHDITFPWVSSNVLVVKVHMQAHHVSIVLMFLIVNHDPFQSKDACDITYSVHYYAIRHLRASPVQCRFKNPETKEL